LFFWLLGFLSIPFNKGMQSASADTIDNTVSLRLTEIDQTLKTKSDLTNTGIHVQAKNFDTKYPLEIHNQGGQGTGNDKGSEVIHHYTDAPAKTIDNVGTNTILLLSNSRNATMRPDKPSDFVGTGALLRYRKFNVTLGDYEEVFNIDANANITKSGKGAGSDGTFNLTQCKTDNGFWGVIFNNVNKHASAYNFKNGGNFLSFLSESSKTKATIVSWADNAGGMEVRAEAGDLYLKAKAGKVQMFYNSAFYPVQPVISVKTTNRPTINLIKGMQIFDETLSKPVWFNGSAWVDATGASV
jgi:hypothetical protein